MATIDHLSPPSPLRVARVESQPFGQNSYVVWTEGGTDCVVIDPGFEPGAILQAIESLGLVPRAILLTHGHSDHIAGNAALRAAWPDVTIAIGRGDVAKLTSPAGNLSAAFGLALVSPSADRLLDQGEVVRVAGLELEVREIPGHSAGHVVFVAHATRPPVVFGGDVLFQEGVGRTDFADGDFDLLATGIRSQLYGLPDDTVVYPGHGEATTVGHEKRHNPFVSAAPGGN